MSQLTQVGSTAAQLHAAAAAARRIAAERESGRAPEHELAPDVGPHPAEIMLPGTEHDESSIRIRDIACRLSAAGLPLELDEIHPGGLYLIAVARQTGGRDAEIILDEDGYAELRWWPSCNAPADEITGLLLGLLSSIGTSALPEE